MPGKKKEYFRLYIMAGTLETIEKFLSYKHPMRRYILSALGKYLAYRDNDHGMNLFYRQSEVKETE